MLRIPVSQGVNPDPLQQGLIISSQNAGWENITLQEFRLPPTEGSFESSCLHEITLCLAPRPHRIMQVIGERRYLGVYSKGDICITPAGVPASYKAEGNDSFILIKLAPQFLQKVAQETADIESNALSLVPEFRVRNSSIEQIAMMLLAELKNGGGQAGKLYVDSLANALTVHLLRDYSTTAPRITLYEGGLNERHLLLVTEYINEHLAEDIKLSDLAELVGISQFHFSRLFKQSMGVSTHQYVIGQRVERAKSLLKKADLSITEIAYLCGFNSHSHLGKYFRQIIGITPKMYRASVKT